MDKETVELLINAGAVVIVVLVLLAFVVVVLAPTLTMLGKVLQQSTEQTKQFTEQTDLMRKAIERGTEAEKLTSQGIQNQNAKLEIVHTDLRAIPTAVTAAQTALSADMSKGFDATNKQVEEQTKLVLQQIAPMVAKLDSLGERLGEIKTATEQHKEAEKTLSEKVNGLLGEFQAARTEIVTTIKEVMKPTPVPVAANGATPVAVAEPSAAETKVENTL